MARQGRDHDQAPIRREHVEVALEVLGSNHVENDVHTAGGLHRDGPVAVGGIDYTAGRESIATYNESLAGGRVPGWVGVGGPRNVSALKADGTLIKYVQNISEMTPPGEADDALMAFQHRMCISGDADRVPWPQPPGYNADDFELIQRALDADAITRAIGARGDGDAVVFAWREGSGVRAVLTRVTS